MNSTCVPDMLQHVYLFSLTYMSAETRIVNNLTAEGTITFAVGTNACIHSVLAGKSGREMNIDRGISRQGGFLVSFFRGRRNNCPNQKAYMRVTVCQHACSRHVNTC